MAKYDVDPLAAVREAYLRWSDRGEAEVEEMLDYIREGWHMTAHELATTVRTLGAKSPVIAVNWLATTLGALKTPTGRLLIMVAASKAARIEAAEKGEPSPPTSELGH